MTFAQGQEAGEKGALITGRAKALQVIPPQQGHLCGSPGDSGVQVWSLLICMPTVHKIQSDLLSL